MPRNRSSIIVLTTAVVTFGYVTADFALTENLNQQLAQATTKKSSAQPTNPPVNLLVDEYQGWGQPNPLLNAIDGRFTLKAYLGYVANLPSSFTEQNKKFNIPTNNTFGWGGSFGWTHLSGFALSADYLGFGNSWRYQNANYYAHYHIITLTPSYRFSFGYDNAWGLKLGLGVGVTLSQTQRSINQITSQYSQLANFTSSHNNLQKRTAIKINQAASYGTTANNNLFSVFFTEFVCNVNDGSSAKVFFDSDPTNAATNLNKCNKPAASVGAPDEIFGNTTDTRIARFLFALGVTPEQIQTLAPAATATAFTANNFYNYTGTIADGVKNNFWWSFNNTDATFRYNITYTPSAGGNVNYGWSAFLDTTAKLQSLLSQVETPLQLEKPTTAPNITNSVYNALTPEEKTNIDNWVRGGYVTATGSTATPNDPTYVPAPNPFIITPILPPRDSQTMGGVAFALAPELTVEYDNNTFHTEITFRYYQNFNELHNIRSNSVSNKLTQSAGPLAFFTGLGIGVNF